MSTRFANIFSFAAKLTLATACDSCTRFCPRLVRTVVYAFVHQAGFLTTESQRHEETAIGETNCADSRSRILMAVFSAAPDTYSPALCLRDSVVNILVFCYPDEKSRRRHSVPGGLCLVPEDFFLRRGDDTTSWVLVAQVVISIVGDSGWFQGKTWASFSFSAPCNEQIFLKNVKKGCNQKKPLNTADEFLNPAATNPAEPTRIDGHIEHRCHRRAHSP